jgi:hypothetical protein
MRSYSILFLFLVSLFATSAFAQNNAEIVAANGQKYAVAGRDRTRNDNEIVVFTPEYYAKKPAFKNGVDVYVVGGKVTVIQDRAGAIYLHNKPDPGAIAVGKDGFVFSANGEARKWVLANVKVGDAVAVNEIKIEKNASGEVVPAASLPCFAGAYYRKAVISFDTWTGIAGIIKLPTPKTDENRLSEKDKQPLDNFSVYLGGRAGAQEIDAGLTWSFRWTKTANKASGVMYGDRSGATKLEQRARRKTVLLVAGRHCSNCRFSIAPKKLRLIVADASPQPKRMFQTDFDAAGFAPVSRASSSASMQLTSLAMKVNPYSRPRRK